MGFSKNRHWISLITVCVLSVTLALGGCNTKNPDDSNGDDGDVSWNIGSTSAPGESDNPSNDQTTPGDAGSTNPSSNSSGTPQQSGSNQGNPTTGGGSTPGSNQPTTAPVTDTKKPVIYYVDSAAGNDNNNGTSDKTPFKSLGRVPHGDLTPGSKVLMKAGSYFKETLGITASGTAKAPIVYDKYGTGAKPVIDGCGQFTTVEIRNVQYFEMRNIKVMNKGKGGNIMRGITLTSGGRKHQGGVLNHLYFINLDIMDLDAKVGRGSAGMYIENGESLKPCYYNDLRIEGCVIADTGSCGIIINSNYGKRPETPNWDAQPLPFTPSTNVVIRNNVIRDLPGDGMWISTTKNAVLEYNTVYNTSYGQNTAYAGMWPHNSDGCVMQYNEVYNNRLAGGDGQGLDVDINCNNTVVQYNYSHDNEGGFILVCTDGVKENYNKNTIIRYNISQNDLHGLVTLKGVTVTGVKVYNNTFYTTKGYSNGTIDCLLWSKNDCTFTNNIFVNNSTNNSGSYGKFVDNKDGEGKSTVNTGINMVFENNVFAGTAKAKAPIDEYNIQIGSGNKIGVDPGLSDPGKGKIGRNTAQGYTLKSGSVCRGAGKSISNNGGKDFFGNKVSGAPSIGACQG